MISFTLDNKEICLSLLSHMCLNLLINQQIPFRIYKHHPRKHK
jgi:hypothetical protein